MKRIYTVIFIILSCLTFNSCKKEDGDKPITQQKVLAGNLIKFSIGNQLYSSQIDAATQSILAVVPQGANKQSLAVYFEASEQAAVSINNVPVVTGSLVDFTSPVTLKITSGDAKNSSVYTVKVKDEIEYYGLGTGNVSGKSLNRSYNYYIDQFDGSTYQSVNCGPSVTAMALHWADANSTITSATARNQIRATGGWWYTSDINNFLAGSNISHVTVAATNLVNTVKNAIDNNNVLILCLDMYPVNRNTNDTEHTDKFYNTTTTDWGHFVLVKGYKIVNSAFYLEVYDPYTNKTSYSINNELKGKDRYYLSSSIKPGVDVWWPYAIVIAAKGNVVTSAARGNKAVLSTSAIPDAYGR